MILLINNNSFKGINIIGKNIVKDQPQNILNIFSDSYTKQEYNNMILNNMISNK